MIFTEPLELQSTETKLSTLVLPLNQSLINDKRYIKLLSKLEKVLLTINNDDLSLFDTEKFLQSFWQKHKTGRIFVLEQKMIYFFNPFIFNLDTKKFGKLQMKAEKDEREVTKEARKMLPQYTMRIEHFFGTYSEPLNRYNHSAGFQGPDIDVTKIFFGQNEL